MPAIDWKHVRKILVVKLRSIGDTVLTTPSLIALRDFLPDAQIDILLEDWVAPVLDGFESVDNVLRVSKNHKERLRVAQKIRKEKYDVALNLHGGTTATFFVRASGAKHRVGYSSYQFSFLYNHRLASAADFWKKEVTHSAEQQMALLGFVGVPVSEKQKTRLSVTETSLESLNEKINGDPLKSKIALIHPVAAFDTKQWATEKFAEVADHLARKGFKIFAVATKTERDVLESLVRFTKAPVIIFDDLTLPEITALASKSTLFVGNDSGIAHIAAAVGTPSVVVFGSSNRNHWSPWTDARNEMVFEEFQCQPCAGYTCAEFDEPKCILSVKSPKVVEAVERVLPGGSLRANIGNV